MISNKIKQLAAERQKLVSLQSSIEAALAKELAALPKQYGFETPAAFLKAVAAATHGRRNSTSNKTSGKRAKITGETRAEVKKLVDAAKTGNEIAAIVGISLPSVQNIKKQLGLVRTRAKK